MKNTREKSLGQITVKQLQSHDLDEIGRNSKINGVDNFALLGGSDQIENEIHFLFYCFKYSKIRGTVSDPKH